MNIAVALLASLALLCIGYLFYSRIIAKIIGLDQTRPTPAHVNHDNIDYVPTKPVILFAHHYASIAAAGPIVGPTLAVMYGYLPGLLWMVLGVILIGAVHDFTALFVSVREGGKSVAEVARKTIGKRGFLFYVAFAFILCVLVSAAFLDLTAVALTSAQPLKGLNLPFDQDLLKTVTAPQELKNVTDQQLNNLKQTFSEGVVNEIYQDRKSLLEKRVNIEEQIRRKADENLMYRKALFELNAIHGRVGGIASMSVVIITLFAPVIGLLVYRAGLKVVFAMILALFVCCFSVWVGFLYPVVVSADVWRLVVLIYCIIAGWIPIWLLLQPRDFTNVQLLYIGLIVMIVSLLLCGIGGVEIKAPATNIQKAQEIPSLGFIWPMLFVTIACGSVSGAHGLICGGTTCKQLSSEKHARPIGYGAMLLETVLGLCVLFAVVSFLSFDKYQQLVWPKEGNGNAPLAFALAVGNALNQGFGLSLSLGTVFGIILLEGFLLTTIDTVIRLSRYLLEEFWKVVLVKPPKILTNRPFNTLIVGLLVAMFAFTNGYQLIWPSFGSANQLLAALTLTIVSLWLLQNRRCIWFTIIPAIFMTVTTLGALFLHISGLIRDKIKSPALLITDCLLVFLAIGFVIMTIKYLITKKTTYA